MSEFTLKQIEVFVAVAECGSFTRASGELYLTQSTVSAHISALEESLGTKLFLRQTRRQVLLTEEGQRIYPLAKKLLGDASLLRAQCRKEAQAGPLELGASTVPGQYLLPLWLAGFARRHADTRYQLRRGDSAQVHRMLRQGEIRLGFVGTMSEPDSFQYVPVATDPLVLIPANTERYRRLQKEGAWGRDLLGEPTVAREQGSGTDRTLQQYMREMGYPQEKLQIVARIEDPETIKRMVAQNVGVSVLSELAVEKEVQSGELLKFPLDEKGLERKVYLIHRRDSVFTDTEQAFVDYIKTRGNP